jgi:hypothetical protein
MLKNFEQIEIISNRENIPIEELVAIDINLSGVFYSKPFDRLRFNVNGDNKLYFSIENNKLSNYIIKGDKLFFQNDPLYNISDFSEDVCETFYTRKDNKVICFNPNHRSQCKGCKFCYQPKSSDTEYISEDLIFSSFKNWMKQNSLTDLSHIEQVAIVTGCFKSEELLVAYLIQLRSYLLKLGFDKEILYFGMINKKESLHKLKSIAPLNICFTVECFSNREIILKNGKFLELNKVIELMEESVNLNIKTNFSYILGLDSLDVFRTRMSKMKKIINTFPIISLYQTNKIRKKYRTKEANYIDYYLKSRKYIEKLFSNSELRPNSWNNYRSLWRTCYGDNNLKI